MGTAFKTGKGLKYKKWARSQWHKLYYIYTWLLNCYLGCPASYMPVTDDSYKF